MFVACLTINTKMHMENSPLTKKQQELIYHLVQMGGVADYSKLIKSNFNKSAPFTKYIFDMCYQKGRVSCTRVDFYQRYKRRKGCNIPHINDFLKKNKWTERIVYIDVKQERSNKIDNLIGYLGE